MDTSKYIKLCPHCGASVEPERTASWGDRVIGGIAGVCGGIIGLGLGGPIGGAAGATACYKIAKHNVISIEDDHDMTQLFKYKCPNCSTTWKERIQTNDNPDAPSWLSNCTGYH